VTSWNEQGVLSRRSSREISRARSSTLSHFAIWLSSSVSRRNSWPTLKTSAESNLVGGEKWKASAVCNFKIEGSWS